MRKWKTQVNKKEEENACHDLELMAFLIVILRDLSIYCESCRFWKIYRATIIVRSLSEVDCFRGNVKWVSEEVRQEKQVRVNDFRWNGKDVSIDRDVLSPDCSWEIFSVSRKRKRIHWQGFLFSFCGVTITVSSHSLRCNCFRPLSIFILRYRTPLSDRKPYPFLLLSGIRCLRVPCCHGHHLIACFWIHGLNDYGNHHFQCISYLQKKAFSPATKTTNCNLCTKKTK